MGSVDMASQQRIFKEPPQNIWKLQKIGTQGLEGCNEGSDYDFFYPPMGSEIQQENGSV